jgi:hypothetical protein
MSPAARLHRIYDKLAAMGADQPMTHTWADVFGIDKSNPHFDDDVTVCVMALRSELDLTRLRLNALGVPENLTSPAFERLRNVAAPGQLLSTWFNHRGNIQPPECRKVFEWAEWALRDEAEPDMPAEDLQQLGAELEALEAALGSTEMTPYLRDFIQRQVDSIRAALRVYGVQGARPLNDALQKVAGAYALERSRVDAEFAAATEPAQGVVTKAVNVIKKTAEVCDSLDKIGKFGEKAVTLAGAVGTLLLPYVTKLVP